MMTRRQKISPEREYDRGLLRSKLVSLFWAVITERKKEPGGFPLQRLADNLPADKAQVSRWFNGLPNWETDTIADIGSVLGVDIQITARDRRNGRIYSASGVLSGVSTATTPLPGSNRMNERPKATGLQRRDSFTISTGMAA
jgi:hypothetical protein